MLRTGSFETAAATTSEVFHRHENWIFIIWTRQAHGRTGEDSILDIPKESACFCSSLSGLESTLYFPVHLLWTEARTWQITLSDSSEAVFTNWHRNNHRYQTPSLISLFVSANWTAGRIYKHVISICWNFYQNVVDALRKRICTWNYRRRERVAGTVKSSINSNSTEVPRLAAAFHREWLFPRWRHIACDHLYNTYFILYVSPWLLLSSQNLADAGSHPLRHPTMCQKQ